MSSTFRGSCLCGAVKYTVSGDPKNSVLCHCDSCQKVTGSVFMANYIYEKDVSTILNPYADRKPDLL